MKHLSLSIVPKRCACRWRRSSWTSRRKQINQSSCVPALRKPSSPRCSFRGQGDLFLPADDSYITLAKEKHLIAEILPLAAMRAVVITRPGFDRPINSWNDVIAPGVRLGLANPEAAAITKLLRDHLRQQGSWDAVSKH